MYEHSKSTHIVLNNYNIVTQLRIHVVIFFTGFGFLRLLCDGIRMKYLRRNALSREMRQTSKIHT